MKLKFAASSEVINYLKARVPKEYIQTIFTSGSTPLSLEPATDLDIFIVMKEKEKNNFLNKLKKDMVNFCRKYKNLTWSMYKGPLKYKDKGLIHFIIYTDNPRLEDDNYSFINEHRLVLKGILTNYVLIKGEDPKKILDNIKIDDKKEIEEFKESMRKRFFILKEENYIEYRVWEKEKGNWDLVKKKIKVDKFFKTYLENYYNKNISR